MICFSRIQYLQQKYKHTPRINRLFWFAFKDSLIFSKSWSRQVIFKNFWKRPIKYFKKNKQTYLLRDWTLGQRSVFLTREYDINTYNLQYKSLTFARKHINDSKNLLIQDKTVLFLLDVSETPQNLIIEENDANFLTDFELQ